MLLYHILLFFCFIVYASQTTDESNVTYPLQPQAPRATKQLFHKNDLAKFVWEMALGRIFWNFNKY